MANSLSSFTPEVWHAALTDGRGYVRASTPIVLPEPWQFKVARVCEAMIVGIIGASILWLLPS